jgi:ribosomal protein S2
MKKPSFDPTQDLDLQNSMAAMQRAALRAREIARQTGTFLVVSRNGVVELIEPDAQALDIPSVQEPATIYKTSTDAA